QGLAGHLIQFEAGFAPSSSPCIVAAVTYQSKFFDKLNRPFLRKWAVFCSCAGSRIHTKCANCKKTCNKQQNRKRKERKDWKKGLEMKKGGIGP
ncbi:MAG: hypothetical protein MR705_07035, partial [Flintibacter sp.]